MLHREQDLLHRRCHGGPSEPSVKPPAAIEPVIRSCSSVWTSVSSFIASWYFSVASSSADFAFAPFVVAFWSLARAELSSVPIGFSASLSALRASSSACSSDKRAGGRPASHAALWAPSAAWTDVFGFCTGGVVEGILARGTDHRVCGLAQPVPAVAL